MKFYFTDIITISNNEKGRIYHKNFLMYCSISFFQDLLDTFFVQEVVLDIEENIVI